ncbi:DUF6151 family protein [Bdellovibrio sp. HCB337]|uniref:DUF6151 family protein n=1 Tax=Bdellovibrio sp. HCB337 TaxID=3394358 RepID=UPI0039A43C26
MKMTVECDCGAVQGTVESKHLKGYRAVCLCDDCQAYAHSIGHADMLDANGGTDIIPVMPSHYTFHKGQEKLQCLRLHSKGMYRWYTSCCKSPLGNTMAEQSMPYIGVPVRAFQKNYSNEQIESEFGPVRERMQARFAKGTLPPKAQQKVSLGFMLRVIKFIGFAKLSGSGKPSPFFKVDGNPISEPKVLSKTERDALVGL